MNKILTLIFLASSLMVASGCAELMVGGAATGVAVAHDRRSTSTFFGDQELGWKVRQSIHSDQIINEKAHINTTVFNGTVLLTGEVPDEALKQKAAQLANQVKGIKQLYNELTVGPPSSLLDRSNDTYITAKVKVALLDNEEGRYDLTHAKVVTEQNVVYLMGMVTPVEAELAVEKSRIVKGVVKVVKLFEYFEPAKAEPTQQ